LYYTTRAANHSLPRPATTACRRFRPPRAVASDPRTRTRDLTTPDSVRLARHSHRRGHDIGCLMQTLELTRRKPRPIASPAQLEATNVPLSNAQGHRHRSRLIPAPLGERRYFRTRAVKVYGPAWGARPFSRITQKPLGQAMWIHNTDER